MSVKDVAKETVRLELAGVGEKKACAEASIDASDAMVERIAGKVMQKLGEVNVSSSNTPSSDCPGSSVNSVQYQRRNQRNGRNRGRGRGRGSQSNNQGRPCRNCGSTEHIVKVCPTRFCQACGGRGHDQFNAICPNYQP